MVLCPPDPVQRSSPCRAPDLDLSSGPADPFPDMPPSQAGPAPGVVAIRPEVLAGFARPRRRPKRMRLVVTTALTAGLALPVAMPHSWWHGAPSRLSAIHVKGTVP